MIVSNHLLIRVFLLLLLLLFTTVISILIRKLLKGVMFNELKKTRSFNKIPLEHQAKGLRSTVFWAALTMGVAGYWAFQRPIFGLLGFIIGPVLFRLWAKYVSRTRGSKFDEEILLVLMTLSGMVRSGLSLPSALNLVSENDRYKVAPHISRYLMRFKSGHSFQEVLGNFQERSGLKHSGPILLLLGMAQSQGLGVAELLEEMTQTLRDILDMDRRIGGLRRSVVAQGVFAALMPWSLLLFLAWFQPEMMGAFFSSASSFYLLAFCFLFQIAGGILLWKVSRFR